MATPSSRRHVEAAVIVRTESPVSAASWASVGRHSPPRGVIGVGRPRGGHRQHRAPRHRVFAQPGANCAVAQVIGNRNNLLSPARRPVPARHTPIGTLDIQTERRCC